MNEALKKAQDTYSKKCKIFTLRVNKETEQDILEWLSRPNAGTRIKELIRKNPLE